MISLTKIQHPKENYERFTNLFNISDKLFLLPLFFVKDLISFLFQNKCRLTECFYPPTAMLLGVNKNAIKG